MTNAITRPSFGISPSTDIRTLHAGLAELGFTIPAAEVKNAVGGVGTQKAIAAFQKARGLNATGLLDSGTAAALELALDRNSYLVEGRVASPDRPAVSGLTVQVIDHSLKGDVKLGEGTTDAQGRYSVRFSAAALRDRKDAAPDLQARVILRKTVIGTSRILYNAGNRSTLNVPLPAGTALPSEHATLTSLLEPHLPGPLGDIDQSDKRQDVIYLANKTGWDARAVAFAALADQLGKLRVGNGRSAASIAPPLYYALLRAGVPANPAALFRISPDSALAVWRQAIASGVIPADLEKTLEGAVGAFKQLAASQALNAPALAGASTLKQLLNGVIADGAQQQRVATLLVEYRHDDDKFWEAVGKELGADVTHRLMLNAQLSHLTINNAPLIDRLHAAEETPLATSADLAHRGYFRAEKWTPLIKDVPSAIPGATDAEKQANYAELLAAQVRLSFPTAVVASLVDTGSLKIPAGAEHRKQMSDFLIAHQDKFEIGMQAVDQYIKRNDLQKTVAPEVATELKRLQRVYQITPDDRALTAMFASEVYSAYHVVQYGEPEFVSKFAKDMGGEDVAKMVHAKARQVHGAVLNVAASYLLAKRGVPIGVHSPPAVVDPVPLPAHADDVVAYATLESLFGSMDYCDCEHCRSILSPAAYLVDLLQFIDRPLNTAGNAQAVLFDRRPDIATLPLTCENTNTPLPHIDLVNETLEYYVTHNLSMAGYSGHSTDDQAAADELIANPQFTNENAYDVLKDPANIQNLFPSPLPFHRPLEALRRYMNGVGVPLRDAMEVLRVDEAVDRANANSYAWRDILMEWVGLSRVEYRLLTDSTLSVKDLYGYSAGAALNDVMHELAGFKVFARRVGVTYMELAAILETRFVNPACSLLPKLQRLRVPFVTIAAVKNNTITDAQFEALLPANLDAAQYGGVLGGNAPAAIRAWIRNQANYDRIMGLIAVSNPTHPGDMSAVDELELRYANPDNTANALRGIDFVRLLRFIRLWKKLGWTIEQTDLAIEALYPAAQLPTGANEAADLLRLDAGFATLIPRLGTTLQLMDRLNVTPSKGLDGLLACFAPIGVHAKEALYRKMFMGAAPPAQDAAFLDDGYGNVLGNGAERALSHMESLRGAFGLTATEFNQIITALQFDANTVLTLDNISAIYRRGWLARTLRISVRELLELAKWTGLDPFAAPDPANPPIVRFLRLVEALGDASIKPSTALFLIWNQDLGGDAAPDDGRISDFASTLRSGFAAIENAFAPVDDPTGEIARGRMTLVYGTDATDFFFGLLNDSLVSSITYSHPTPTLSGAIATAGGGRLAYDDLRKRLTYTGVLSVATRDAIKLAGVGTAAFPPAIDALYALNQNAVGAFFRRYPELLPYYDAYVASALPAEDRRTALLANFLPELKRRRKRSQAIVTAGAASHAPADLTQSVLDDMAVLHAITDNGAPAVDDLTAIETPGLSASYFWRNTATGNVDSTSDAEAVLDYTGAGPVKLPANPNTGPISGIWAGTLAVPESGFFNFAVETDAGTTVRLSLDGVDRPLVNAANTWSNAAPIELTAGTLIPITLTVERVTTRLCVRWESTGRGWEVLPGESLYSARLTDRLRRVFIALLKAASLADGLKLTAAELSHLAKDADFVVVGQGWVNSLAISGSPSNPALAPLLAVLSGVLDFARIKKALSPADDRFLQVLRTPTLTLPSGDVALSALTGWQDQSIDTLLLRFGGLARAQLAHVAVFRRIFDAYDLVTTAGVSAPALISATTNEPTAATVAGLLSALRARYDRNDWLQVLTPINDELRVLQRDALVAYVLRRMAANPLSAHIDTPDKLFEYFLMDVQMQPCMQTTRILHATASVQLFIDRCLMNLEPRVPPANLDPGQWAWMKRYRVWEANRKVFLWPENWLEPELRDDQSPFFKEVMGELLQSDITEDSAATALQNYLSRLEDVAKLEPCGIAQVELLPGEADDTVHVVARTAGAHRKYYYRRQDNGTTWGPWDQIKLDIEDNPVIPVVWGNRLFVFWLRILTRTPLDPETQAATDTQTTPQKVSDMTLAAAKNEARNEAKNEARSIVEAILCWSEYFNGKWQAVRTSNTDRPANLGLYAPDQRSARRFDRRKLTLYSSVDNGGLRITIAGSNASSSPWFLLYNTHSIPVRSEDWTGGLVTLIGNSRTIDTSGDILAATYTQLIGAPMNRNILRNKLDAAGDAAIYPTHTLDDPWAAPFFYHDHRHVYYVTSSEEWVTLTRTKWVGSSGGDPSEKLRVPPMVYEPYQEIRVPDPEPNGDPYINVQNPGVIDEQEAMFEFNKNSNIVAGIGSTGVAQYNGQRITFDQSFSAGKIGTEGMGGPT